MLSSRTPRSVGQGHTVCRLETPHSVPLHRPLEALADTIQSALPLSVIIAITDDVADTSTNCPGTKCPADISVPTGKTASWVTLNSCTSYFGGTPAFLKCPSSWAEVVFSGRSEAPSWSAWRCAVDDGVGVVDGGGGVCWTT